MLDQRLRKTEIHIRLAKPAPAKNNTKGENSNKKNEISVPPGMKAQPIQEETDFEGLFDLNEDSFMRKSLAEMEREIGEALGICSDSTGSSSGSEDCPTDEESCGEEDKQEYTEVIELKDKLEKMMSTNSFDEVLGLLVVKTLSEIPMSKEILSETHIGGTVNNFRKMSNNKETNKLGYELITRWKKLVPQSPKINQATREGDQLKMVVEHSMKRPSRDSESGTEDPVYVKKQKPEGDTDENLTESQICSMEVTNTVIEPDIKNKSDKENHASAIEIAQNIDTNRNDEVYLISHEIEQDSDKVTMDYSETKDLYVYLKGMQTDITRASSFRVLEDIQQLIQRIPVVKKSNQSLRVTCQNNHEKQSLLDSHYIAGYRVTCTEPYEKTRNFSNRQNIGIIFDVDEGVPIEQIEQVIGVKAKRNTKRVKGQNTITRQVILFFDDEIPDFVYLAGDVSESRYIYRNPLDVTTVRVMGIKAGQMQVEIEMPRLCEKSLL